MVAKGLDFHRVTLVGVILADIGLLMPDFRAGERTFQLLAQVAGRAGRGALAGEVIIQTYSPNHVCLVRARAHDYKSFYHYEIQQRQQLGYPPFHRLALILFRNVQESHAQDAAQEFAKTLRATGKNFAIYGPSPSPLERLQNQFRYQILLKNDRTRDPAAAQMRQALEAAYQTFKRQRQFSRVRVSIDIDPMTML
jgi:primosomal protein N' (replication factor Y)